eukprot:CAMPEP_0172156394 /NCGR_PEP_ID=MMETSP1050-20130122/3177_1 /TAXON_ID=233186 /ORGANISM="Cryptomonas curvata, Strain CCAP979/52" /LENGTH=698 /DNA_ID=CAMNT_0012825439 /DNA_START=50 /DNA_END=2146 /DNA_ORIENTATION=+
MVDAFFDEVQIQDCINPEEDDVMEIPEEDSFVCPAQHGRPLQQKKGEEGILRTQSQDDSLNFLGVVGLQDVDPVAEILKEIGASAPFAKVPFENIDSTSPNNDIEDMHDKFAAIVNDKSSYSRVMSARSVSPDRTDISERSLIRRALCPPPNSRSDSELSTSAYSPQMPISGSPTSVIGAELLSLESKRVSAISGIVSEWPISVTFHYSDGTSTTYATADFVEAADPIPALQFRLHQSEHISAVVYKHTCAALNQRILGSGIEFQTSFGRSFLLCGKPDPFFSWGSRSDKTEWRVPPTHGIVGLCLGKEWHTDDDEKFVQRDVEWCPKELASVLDVVGVLRAPSQALVCDGVVGLRAEQILGKERVLKMRLRGECLAVTDWDETWLWRKPDGEPTGAKVGSQDSVAEGPAPALYARRGNGSVWTISKETGRWTCGQYTSPVTGQYKGWLQDHVGCVEDDISLIARSNVPQFCPWRRAGQKTMGVRVCWMAIHIPLYTLCELEDSDARGKRVLFDVCDGKRLLGFAEASIEEIMSAALQGSPLQLRPAPAPRNVLRLVLGLRIDTQALPRGTQLAISCAAGRRGPDGHFVEICRAEWTRNAKMQRFIGYGENSWWQGDVGVGRFEMLAADSDGPAELDFGDLQRPIEFEISLRRVHGAISSMPQTDYYGEIEATVNELMGSNEHQQSSGIRQSTFPVCH